MEGQGWWKIGSRAWRVTPILAALLLLAGVVAPSDAYERPGKTIRVSVGSDGSESEPILTGDCWRVAGGPALRQFDISANGRFVAFTTDAPNLVSGDNNFSCDVFVHDLKTGKSERVSQPATGTDSVGVCAGIGGGTNASTGSSGPSLSASGRYVAFHSCATNLVPGDTNGLADIFVADRKSGSIGRVSLTISDQQVLGLVHALTPSISSDGQVVAYFGSADDLTTSPLGSPRIWVRDLASGQIQLASSCGSTGCGAGEYPTISGDGRYVSYTYSLNGNTDSADTNLTGYDVVRFDRKRDKIQLVSVTDTNTSGNNKPVFDFSLGTRSYGGRTMSEDGRYVAFASHASNLIPNDGNHDPLNGSDVFVRDMVTGRTERVSVGSSGQELYLSRQDEACNRIEGACLPVNNYWYPAISGNGRFVIFATGGTARIIVHDRLTGQNTIAVRSPQGGAPDCISEGQERDREGNNLRMNPGALSGNGRIAVFGSNCESLVAGDTNGHYDTFARDLGPFLGASGLGGSPLPSKTHRTTQICTNPERCPQGAAVSSADDVDDLNDVLTEQGANLHSMSLAYRPQYEDLFVAIELEHMPKVLPGVSPIFYGLRFAVEGKSYEVRATSLNFGTFGLFDCTDSRPLCTRVADLEGGYGTTGERVVFSLPLDDIGLEKGGDLRDVVAFSGVGTLLTGANRILDQLRIR